LFNLLFFFFNIITIIVQNLSPQSKHVRLAMVPARHQRHKTTKDMATLRLRKHGRMARSTRLHKNAEPKKALHII
jgi:hypothetical protein